MPIEKFQIARNPAWYLAWPDIALTRSGKLLCVFTECAHHSDRSHTRIMRTESANRGRSWSAPVPLTESSDTLPFSYNCARISRTAPGRLTVIVDRVPREGGENNADRAVNVLYHSCDDGASWSEPVETSLRGIVPDKVLRLDNGRLLITAHHAEQGRLAQFLRYSDDDGRTWSDAVTLAADARFQLCEASLLPLGDGIVVAFLRENSGLGYDCKKTISRDNGESWGPLIDFPLPGCHRPVAGLLRDGRIFITYRFMQGGRGWLGAWTQNFFAALSDRESVLTEDRRGAATRIIPIDYDRSGKSDLGYSGWVQFADGEIYIVNYIVDDAIDKGQIRGYSVNPSEFVLEGK